MIYMFIGALLAVPAAAVDPFVAPYSQKEWTRSGDARVLDTGVELAHSPGQSGAVWFDSVVPYTDFTLEAVLRTRADQNEPAGNSGYTIWYTSSPLKKPQNSKTHGGDDTFDGLAVMLDNYFGASLGSVRGHLNDGSIKFSSLEDVGSESLSLCRLDYRNTPVPISIKIGYSQEGFVVTVNNQKCFYSTDVVLPSGYFGISANTDKTKDVLTVERMSIREGMSSEMQQLLPTHESKNAAPAANAAKEAAPAKEAPAKNAAPASDNSQNWQLSAAGLTKQELLEVMQPTLTRVELMEIKLQQVQSAVDQLTESLLSSLNALSEARAKGGSAPVPDLTGLQREIVSMRNQLSDYRKSAAPTVAAAKSSIWPLVAVLVPIQLAVIVVYHAWLKRGEQHEKLL